MSFHPCIESGNEFRSRHSVRRLRLLAASYLRDWYRSSHLPFGNNQRKNRLVVRCMFSCGIEPRWPGPRCWEHKNRLRPRYGNFKTTVCPWNNFILNQELNLSSPSFILNVFILKWVYDKNAVLFLLCRSFSRVSAFNFYLLIQLLHWKSSVCTVQVRLVNVRKCKGSSVKNIAHFKQESLATGRATPRITFQVGDSLNHALA